MMQSGHPLPLVGAEVEVVTSAATTGWTRIDVGRRVRVIGYDCHSWRTEHGPRVHVLGVFSEPRKWDSHGRAPIRFAPSQLSLTDAAA